MTLVSGFSDLIPGGIAGSPKTGDLSAAITSGLTNAKIRITNSHSDDITTLSMRDTGTTDYYTTQLMPGFFQDVEISLPSSNARTFEYFFVGGALQVDVVSAWGSGYSSDVSLSDIENELIDLGYVVSATGDITSTSVQRALNDATSEVNTAASRYALIAMQTLNSGWKNTVIKRGAVAHALFKLRNKGTSQGRTTAQAIGVSDGTANDKMADYRVIVERIASGIFYGA